MDIILYDLTSPSLCKSCVYPTQPRYTPCVLENTTLRQGFSGPICTLFYYHDCVYDGILSTLRYQLHIKVVYEKVDFLGRRRGRFFGVGAHFTSFDNPFYISVEIQLISTYLVSTSGPLPSNSVNKPTCIYISTQSARSPLVTDTTLLTLEPSKP